MRFSIHLTAAVALIVAATAAAFHSASQDSLTFDEPAHLTAGVSFWKTGDFRLLYATPPLVHLWAGLPAALANPDWNIREATGWSGAEVWEVAREWLARPEAVQRSVMPSRAMMIVLYAGCLGTVYLLARRLFGPGGGLFALLVAACSPALLAHGRLVTTDVAISLAMLLVVACFARWLERPSWALAAATGVSLAAAALVKYSWPIVLGPLLLLGIGAAVAAWRRPATVQQAPPARHSLARTGGLLLLCAAVPWLAIWTAFGWRYAAHANDEGSRSRMIWFRDGRRAPIGMEAAWLRLGTLPDRTAAPGPALPLVTKLREWRLLPEAYLYGLLYTARAADDRLAAYMCGTVNQSGWYAYFPVVWAVKMPHAAQLALLAAIAALALRQARPQSRPLLWGLALLAGVYVVVAILSRMNLGERHLLPAYLPLFVLSGAAAAWWRARWGRVALGAIAAGLLLTVALAHPRYLPYFNELSGGRAQGHYWLLDSNLDWGQDLQRLAAWQRLHPGEGEPYLLYFGSAPLSGYGVQARTMLNSAGATPTVEAFRGGTYIISVSELFSIFTEAARDEFWNDPLNRAEYARLYREAQERGLTFSASPRLMQWQQTRLVRALRQRPPDEQVGDCFRVFRLSAAEVERVLSPQEQVSPERPE